MTPIFSERFFVCLLSFLILRNVIFVIDVLLRDVAFVNVWATPYK